MYVLCYGAKYSSLFMLDKNNESHGAIAQSHWRVTIKIYLSVGRETTGFSRAARKRVSHSVRAGKQHILARHSN